MEDQAAAAQAVAARLVQQNAGAYEGEPGTTEPPAEGAEPEQNAEAAGKRKFEGGFQDALDGSDPTDGTRKRTGFSGPEVKAARPPLHSPAARISTRLCAVRS